RLPAQRIPSQANFKSQKAICDSPALEGGDFKPRSKKKSARPLLLGVLGDGAEEGERCGIASNAGRTFREQDRIRDGNRQAMLSGK
ncbi:hypothetical protein, partial [Mesorhizobium sp.]